MKFFASCVHHRSFKKYRSIYYILQTIINKKPHTYWQLIQIDIEHFSLFAGLIVLPTEWYWALLLVGRADCIACWRILSTSPCWHGWLYCLLKDIEHFSLLAGLIVLPAEGYWVLLLVGKADCIACWKILSSSPCWQGWLYCLPTLPTPKGFWVWR